MDKQPTPSLLIRKEYKVPRYADFLIAYCQFADYKSNRNDKDGSVFVQTVCKVLNKHKEGDLLSNLTQVNQEVVEETKSTSTMQIPCFFSTLTRKVVFDKKP